MTGRFLQLDEVGEILDISPSQTYALVRTGKLPAIKVGGRGQWRVETNQVEDYIQRAYAETKVFVDANPMHPAQPLKQTQLFHRGRRRLQRRGAPTLPSSTRARSVPAPVLSRCQAHPGPNRATRA